MALRLLQREGCEGYLDKMETNAGTINSAPDKFVVDPSVIAAFSIEPDPEGTITYPDYLINSSSSSDVANLVKKGFGKIVYDNTKLNVKEFKVRIPITIQYGLGEFDVIVPCTVKATL